MTRPEPGCREALALLAGWSSHSPDADELAAAADHVAGCRVCQAGFDRLALAVQSGLDDEISCAECETRLDAYYQMAAAGGDVASEMPIVDRHLEGCGDCRSSLSALGEVMVALSEGTLPTAGAYPAFDTSFVLPVPDTRADDIEVKQTGLAMVPATALLVGDLVSRAQSSSRRATRAARTWVEGADWALAGDAESPDWLRRLGPAISTGALLPVVALLLIALAITWRSMQTAAPEPPPDATAAAATGTAAVRDMTATAQAEASRRPGAPTGTPDAGLAPAALPISSPTPLLPTETPTATAAGTEERTNRSDRRDDDSRRDGAPSRATEADDVMTEPEVTLIPGVPMETAYPRPPTLSPPTAYPPPPTRWRPPTPLPTSEGRLPTAES